MYENRDLLLDEVTHDLDISGYNLKLCASTRAISQRLKVRLKTFLGEWFLDRTAGVPYYESILIKNPDLALIDSIMRGLILTVPQVTELLALELDLDALTRRLFIDFTVKTESGDVIDNNLVIP